MQEVGVKFKIDGQDSVFKGSIGPLTSDNLGAHCIGGFIEGFNSLRICRVCMGTSNDIQTKVGQVSLSLKNNLISPVSCEVICINL